MDRFTGIRAACRKRACLTLACAAALAVVALPLILSPRPANSAEDEQSSSRFDSIMIPPGAIPALSRPSQTSEPPARIPAADAPTSRQPRDEMIAMPPPPPAGLNLAGENIMPGVAKHSPELDSAPRQKLPMVIPMPAEIVQPKPAIPAAVESRAAQAPPMPALVMNPLVDAVGDANLPDSGELRSCVSSRRVATDPKPDDPDALPWGPSVPTPELAAMAQRAEETARHGFDLAERGALFSARGEFIDVLRNVAQAVDAQRSSTVHAKALAAGLRAMEEVDDFVPRGSRLETDVNLKLVVDAHRTPVLKHRSLERMQPLEAQRAYLSYAQEQLTSAAADQAVASLALHGLGKICLAPAEMHGPREQIAEAKAVVFFQAALIIEPNNFLAANELGVALARFGHLEDSRRVLLQAARTSNNPTSWRNLAAVYRRMGDQARADDARRQADSIVAKLQQNGNSTAGTRYPIQWVDVGTFTRNNSMVAGPPRPAAEAASAPAAETATKTDAKTGGWPWSMK